MVPQQEKLETAAMLMSESAKKKQEAKYQGMSQLEREAEQAAVDAEMRAKKDMIDQVRQLWEVQAAERKARIEKGEATRWDRVATAWNSLGSSSDKKE